jgi:hypothetical protein
MELLKEEIKEDLIDNKFIKNLEELLYLSPKKYNITYFLKNNFKENIHYIIKTNDKTIKQHGGQNKIYYFLTNETFELFKNTFKLKHRYITKINNLEHVNIIMSLENQTIGFIENSFKNTIKTKRQFQILNYRVDLYFPEYKLVVECDENNHIDRNKIDESVRENYILSLGNTIIRFNPNDKLFDLSIVL